MKKLIEMLGWRPTFDAAAWKTKMTTKLQLLQAALAAMLLAWMTLGDKIQNSLPVWVLWVLGGGTIAIAGLTVLAANTHQAKVQEKVIEKRLEENDTPAS